MMATEKTTGLISNNTCLNFVFEILKSKQIPVISVGIMKAPVFLICLK